MKNKIFKVIALSVALAVPVSASANIYTIDRDTGQIYKVDANNYSVTSVGSPLNETFLSSLTKHSNGQYPNIDITYLKGYIYGLVGNARSDDPALLFRVDRQGQLDMGFGNGGVRTLSLDGQSPFMRSTEGLASNGTNLLIAHSTRNERSALSSIISEYNVTSNSVVNSSPVRNFDGAPSTPLLTDMDGLGAYAGRAMSVDIRNSKSHVIDLGQLPNGNFNDMYNVNAGSFGDVAFVNENKFVVAGDYTVNGNRRNGLHFFQNVNGQASYMNTVQIPDEEGIFAVASTTENQEIIEYPPVPNGEHYQCYLLDKGDDVKAEEISIRDQFGSSRVVLGRPVMLCNPSEKTHNGKQFKRMDEERHLVCYNYVKQGRVERHNLRIQTQFGKDDVTSSRREMFCAPAGKAHVDKITAKPKRSAR